MEDVKKSEGIHMLRVIPNIVREGPYQGIFREFSHEPRKLMESHFEILKDKYLEMAKAGQPFNVDLYLQTYDSNGGEIQSKLSVDVQIEDSLFIITMAGEEDNLFSNSVFKTRSPIGLETYIQGNMSVWAQSFVKQVKKQLDEENEKIRLKMEAEAAAKAKQRV